MKKYVFLITLVTGVTFNEIGEGHSQGEAFMDVCDILADVANLSEDDVVGIDFVKMQED